MQTYSEFQWDCSRCGFISTPLTEQQHAACIAASIDPYPVACDVAAGFSFADCMRDTPNIDDTLIIDLL